MTPRRFLLTTVLLWCLAIIATPILALYGGVLLNVASYSYRIFSHVCHQLDSRSFYIGGEKFAVCIRCFSIYAAFFFGMLWYPRIPKDVLDRFSSRTLLIVSLIPMGTDVLLAVLGIHASTAATRIVTGVFFGMTLGIVLTPLLEEVVGEFFLHMRAKSDLTKQTN